MTDLLYEDLTEEGYNCITAATGEEALVRLSMNNSDVVLLDLRLPGISGMDVLRELRSTYPKTLVIVITAAADAQTAVEAMKIGALDYITKPFEPKRVNDSIETALQVVWGSKPAAGKEGTKVNSDETDWMRNLDCISCGVALRLEWLTGHVMNKTIVEMTIDIARSLGIPEDQIEEWSDAERKLIKWINSLGPLLDTVEVSPATSSMQRKALIGFNAMIPRPIGAPG